MDFLGDDFDEFLYSAQCLVRQRIHAHASDHGGSGVEVADLVNTGSGMCSACLLVRIFLALCSLPRGQAHEAWHHGRYAQKDSYALSSGIALFPVGLAHDAWHHGRYGPDGPLCAWQ